DFAPRRKERQENYPWALTNPGSTLLRGRENRPDSLLGSRKKARFLSAPGGTLPISNSNEVVMGYSVGIAAVAGAAVMLVCFMLDFHIVISLLASLGTMGVLAFKTESLSKRKQTDQRLLLPSDEPPVNN